jgi:hypothetical protein
MPGMDLAPTSVVIVNASFPMVLACAPRPSSREILVDLAEAHADELFRGIESGVEADIGSLWDLESGSTHDGTLALPEDAGKVWDADATLDVVWEVSYVLDDEEGIRTWNWAIALDLGRLALSSCEVSGALGGMVEDVARDLHYANHAWQGDVAIDGDDAVPVEWTAYWSGNLHRVDGSVDGEAVHWENDEPDLP